MNDIFTRSKSAHWTNYTNIELHSCLNEARNYQDQVNNHFSKSQFQNHTLASAQRFYKKNKKLGLSSSLSSFKKSKSTLSTHKDSGQPFLDQIKQNPQSLMNLFERKALRVSELKTNFVSAVQQKMQLTENSIRLKKLIVEQKNKKAKISLRNCKLMNAVQLSNHKISNLNEQSRRNNILINELVNDVNALETELSELDSENRYYSNEIQHMKRITQQTDEYVHNTKRKLMAERKELQALKQDQTVNYKEMTNHYMILNQFKEEKALLLNSIDIDVLNNR